MIKHVVTLEVVWCDEKELSEEKLYDVINELDVVEMGYVITKIERKRED